VVPPIIEFRRDCSYGKLAAMRLPKDVQGLGTCEYSLQLGVVHACHADGVVHFLEGYEHREVGAIDVDGIVVVWEVALRHGLRTPSMTGPELHDVLSWAFLLHGVLFQSSPLGCFRLP
jgi:hypothetical protein